MSKLMKTILLQFVLISTCILFGTGFFCLVTGSHNSWPWYMPFEVLGIALVTACGTLIHCSTKEVSKKEFIVRSVIHFIVLLGIVVGAGYLFKWWSEIPSLLIICAIFVFVYAVVFTVMYLKQKNDSNKINEALKKLDNDEE